MKPWRNIVVPHRDIREGRLDESVFAASLSDAVQGRGPLEYHDAASFFRKTYPTRGLVHLLAAASDRLSGRPNSEPIIQVQTPFGGGKTHALVALYHLVRAGRSDPAALADIRREIGGGPPADARVVTFDGVAADALEGKTPWGEIAAQLGAYDALRQHDERRRSPGKDRLYEVLAGAPTLILMDEIAEYAVKARDFLDQVLAFCQDLTEAVKVLPHGCLVVALPSSAPYGEQGERALHQLQSIFGRVESIYTSVEGVEVYEVIRRRLFEQPGEPAEVARVVDEYWQMYQQLGEDAPAEAREPAYRERMRLAYPFHPQLIDLLYERWSTFATFQRTRGALRLLANIVADLYNREHAAPLIQAAHINLAQPQIRREFLKHIGNEYEGVIAADIVDTNAKAQRMDRELGSEYARFNVASGLATAIFFGSFSGGERRGINAAALRLALLREGIPPAIVGDALGRLEDELWFLHVDRGLYEFRSQPNLNRVIVEREDAVSEPEIAAEIRNRLASVAGTELKTTLFPETPGDIPDSRELKLAVLGGGYPGRDPATTQFVDGLLTRASGAFRAYRNTLLVLAPDAGAFATLRQQVKRYLTLKSIAGDKTLLASLSDDNKEVLRSKLKDAEGGIGFHLLAAYRHLARASADGGVVWYDLGLPTTGERASLARRVRDYLRGQDILLDRLGARQLLEKAMGQEETEKSLADLYEAFLRYPHLPILEGEDVLRRTVAQGVREGAFAIRTPTGLTIREPVADYKLQGDVMLVRPEVVPVAAPAEPPVREGADEGTPPPVAPETPGMETIVKPAEVTRLRLRVRVPWDKMSDFLRGVVMPLRGDGAELGIEIEVDARAAGGIKKVTLEQKVEETLRQIGAQVLEERRE